MLALFSGYLHFHFALEACIKGYQTVSLFAHAFATEFVHYVSDIVEKHIIDGPVCTELDRSGIGRNKEQSARILGHLVANSPTLIRPYVEPIVNVLIPKLKETETNPMVITSVLSAIGMKILLLLSFDRKNNILIMQCLQAFDYIP
jgi:hypothetical protein